VPSGDLRPEQDSRRQREPDSNLEWRSRTSSRQSAHIPSLENECPTVAADGETNYGNDALAVSAIYLQRAITAGSRGTRAVAAGWHFPATTPGEKSVKSTLRGVG
jgi:hypothetical protein